MKKIYYYISILILALSVLSISCEDENDTNPEGEPDLVGTELEVTSYTYTEINYSYTLSNIGNAPANLDGPTDENYDNVSVQAFMSQDSIYDAGIDIAAGGTIIGVSPLGYLQPNDSVSGDFRCTYEVNTVNINTHSYLLLIVDWGNSVDESNENNNIIFTRIGQVYCYFDLPNPELIFTGTEDYEANGQEWTRYRMDVTNKSSFPDSLFHTFAGLPPCGNNTNSSRSWVDIYDNNDNRIYGFCALGHSSNLGLIWFAEPRGENPPDSVYITIEDRACELIYTSNYIVFNK